MTTTSGVSGASGVSGLNLSGEMNLSIMFAMLQLEMAAEKKEQANSIISDIKAENEVLRQAREHLAKARQLQSAAGDSNVSDETAEMKAFREKYGISFDSTGGDTLHNKTEWDVNIKNLESFIESRGMDTQTKMVQLEDLMGKYNAWTQGASKTISDGNQLLQSISTR
jgi:hypothetical protein